MIEKEVTVTAPGKLMLFGEHAVMYGEPCIVTAVDQRMTLVATPIKESKLKIDAPDVGVIGYEVNLDEIGLIGTGPKGARFVEAAVKIFKDKFELPFGVKINTTSEFQTSGLGSSSASAVCTISALSELTGSELNKKELFNLSYQTVLEVQKVGSGFDVAAVVWGGTLYYLYGGKEIRPLNVGDLPLVIAHSGIKAETPVMVKKVKDQYKKNRGIMDDIFGLMGEITQQAKGALENGDFQRVGELADMNQGLLEALGVSCQELSRLIYAARDSGAYGAKLSGAGGGDCMVAFVDEEVRNSVEQSLKQAGGKILDVKSNANGVRIEK